MDGSTFLIFIVGFFIGMTFLKWISKNKNTSQDQKKERVHYEDQGEENNPTSSISNNKTRSKF